MVFRKRLALAALALRDGELTRMRFMVKRFGVLMSSGV